jgi:hypothetical protein
LALLWYSQCSQARQGQHCHGAGSYRGHREAAVRAEGVN